MSKSILVETPVEDPNQSPTSQENDELNNQKPTQEDDYKRPAAFEGKTDRELIEMVEESQTQIGRQANEVGTWRQLAQDLVETRGAPAGQDEPEDETPPTVTADDLLANPSEVITDLVQRAIANETRPIKEAQAQSRAVSDLEKFESDYPDYVATAETSEFQDWAMAKPTRLADAQAAAGGDLLAARRLLENWDDLKPVSSENDDDTTNDDTDNSNKANLDAARRVAGDAPNSGGGGSNKPLVRQSEVVKLINSDPDKYRSAAYQNELKAAIKEGRFRPDA